MFLAGGLTRNTVCTWHDTPLAMKGAQGMREEAPDWGSQWTFVLAFGPTWHNGKLLQDNVYGVEQTTRNWRIKHKEIFCLLKVVLYGHFNVMFTMRTITVSEIHIYSMGALYQVISFSSVRWGLHILCKINFLSILILRTAKLSWKD